jgi:DHA1 family tetracycline resistance protein-like MFS transporter
MPVLFLTVVIDLIGFGIIIPIMPFMAPELGGNDMDIALIIIVYAVFAGVCGPFWGRLSDRIGRKPVILTCLAGTALSYVLLAFSTTLWMVYLSRAFCGLMAGNFGVVSAMIADITSPENRAKGMGLVGAAFAVGMVVGPTLGGLLTGDELNFVRPALAAASLSLLAIIAGSLVLKESLTPELRQQYAAHHHGKPKQSVFAMVKHSGNLLLASQYFIHNSCVSLVSFLFPLLVRDKLGWGPQEIGIVFGIQGLMMAIVQTTCIGPLSKKFGELRCLLGGVSTMIIGFLFFTFFASNQAMMITSVFITITGATCCTPMLNSLTSKRTPPPMRGKMMGTTSSISSWGRVSGPMVGGSLLSMAGFPLAWGAGLIFGSVYISWVIYELRKPAESSKKPA